MSAKPSGAVVPKYKVMVIGKTGAGKSSFCNFVLGRETFVTSSGFGAVTGKAAADSVTVEGFELYLVDTPGFGDPASMEDEGDMGLEEMARGLQLAIQDGDPGVDAIVYVISAPDRFSNDEHAAIEAIKDSLFWSHVLVVFTNADRVGSQDKRQYVRKALSEPSCPEALKLLMDRAEGRFMIVNSLDARSDYRQDHLLTFISNLRSLNEKNKGKRYSHQLFLDIHERYKDLKAQSKTQSKAIDMLLEQADGMQKSYTEQIEELEVTIASQRNEIQRLKQQGQNVDQLGNGVRANEEEKRKKQQQLKDQMKELQAQIKACREAEEKRILEQHVKDLKKEVDALKCSNRLCLLL